MKKYVVTAYDEMTGMRENISIPLPKSDAEKFKRKLMKEMKWAIPKYRTLKNFRIKEVK